MQNVNDFFNFFFKDNINLLMFHDGFNSKHHGMARNSGKCGEVFENKHCVIHLVCANSGGLRCMAARCFFFQILLLADVN